MSLFQSNLRKRIRNLPKILNFVKKIHYYSKLLTSLLIEDRAAAGSRGAPPARARGLHFRFRKFFRHLVFVLLQREGQHYQSCLSEICPRSFPDFSLAGWLASLLAACVGGNSVSRFVRLHSQTSRQYSVRIPSVCGRLGPTSLTSSYVFFDTTPLEGASRVRSVQKKRTWKNVAFWHFSHFLKFKLQTCEIEVAYPQLLIFGNRSFCNAIFYGESHRGLSRKNEKRWEETKTNLSM